MSPTELSQILREGGRRAQAEAAMSSARCREFYIYFLIFWMISYYNRASVTDCHATSLAWSSRQISGLGSWKARSLDLALTPCSYGTLAKLLPISGTQFGHLYSENVGKEFPGSVLVATVR